MISGQKCCSKCKQTKPLIAFGSKGLGRDGKTRLRGHCKKCHALEPRSRASRAGPGEQQAPGPQEQVKIINAFALWFGPVLRHLPLSWRP